VKQNVTTLVHNPLGVAAEKLLVLAALSVLRGLRSRRSTRDRRAPARNDCSSRRTAAGPRAARLRQIQFPRLHAVIFCSPLWGRSFRL
jgi:hypothetical protein